MDIIHAHLNDALTGYCFACDDHVLLFLAVAIHRQALGLPLLAVLADLKRAFPRTWRQLVICYAKDCLDPAHILILADLLSYNDVLVTQGSVSVARLVRGLAEGGNLGSLLYPLLPNELANVLDRLELGAAVAPESRRQYIVLYPCASADNVLLDAIDQQSWKVPLLLHADDQLFPVSNLTAGQSVLDVASTWLATNQ